MKGNYREELLGAKDGEKGKSKGEEYESNGLQDPISLNPHHRIEILVNHSPGKGRTHAALSNGRGDRKIQNPGGM